MKLIPLTRGLFAKVDDEDFEILNQFKWHVNHCGSFFYAVRNVKIGIKQRHEIMHRVVMLGQPGEIIDHIDHDTLNNQKSNLRRCDRQQNARNSRAVVRSNSKYKGVHRRKNSGKWQAMIRTGDKNLHIGIYETEIQAAIAYNRAAIKYHGEFAYLNNIDKQLTA